MDSIKINELKKENIELKVLLVESNEHDSHDSEGFSTFLSWYGDDNDVNDDKIADNDNDDDDGDDDDLEEENCVKAVALARFHSTEAPCGALSASTHLLLQ